MLTLDRLCVGYGKTRVVADVSLDVRPGEVVALLGRNGMGKTTLLRGIFGLCDVFSGAVSLDGQPLPTDRPDVLARHGLTLMPDDRGVFPTLTIEENLRLARRRGYVPPVEVTDVFPLLAERPKQLAGNLSGGQKQQLALGRAILAGERAIVIDEFSQGLQPSIAKTAFETLRTVAANDVSVFVVEQVPQLAVAYADRILGMTKGSIVFDERAALLRENPEPLTDLLVI